MRFNSAGNAVQTVSEGELLRRACAGDREAFGALVRCYWPRVLRWLSGCTGQPAVAEDLTQEVFLKAWANLKTMQGQADNFRAWLYRIAANALVDWRRRQQVQQRRLKSWAGLRSPVDPFDHVVRQELQERLWQAVVRLPLDYRMALLLRAQEQLSFREIGDLLGISEETARWRVFRARALLLRMVGAWLDAESDEAGLDQSPTQPEASDTPARKSP
ncbi:MAG: sigma-70 family RNA polymerase sigma factor [Gemmatales bacterium]|nr:sigma-70 family RNA polymerase sigma factor [Gemmatales bacterium]MDW8223656.1 sigma-70 family RNA polymerase sigma factor [Gemmatales bacterium]